MGYSKRRESAFPATLNSVSLSRWGSILFPDGISFVSVLSTSRSLNNTFKDETMMGSEARDRTWDHSINSRTLYR